MFKIGDIIVYGSAGVYKIENISALKGISCADKKKKYYVLKPYFGEGVVYYPIDGEKVFIRPILSSEQVNKIIDDIPSMSCETNSDDNIRTLSEKYRESLNSHSCTDLLSLVMSVYTKKRLCKEQNRKIGQIDESFMKQAEALLYSEFGAALGIDRDCVQDYIKRRISAV